MFGKTFGVELEFLAPRGASRATIAEALSAAGVPAYDAGYTHAVSPRWKIVSDGSVLGNGEPMELVSPILQGDAGMAAVQKACDVLTTLGCTVNKSCGLHVHVGARTMQVAAMRKLAIFYSDFEGVIDNLMAPSRRGNSNMYLQSLARINKNGVSVASDARGIAGYINNGSRYAKLNFTSHWKHGTVEFRHHAGTIAAAKVQYWIVACIKMVLHAEQNAGAPVAISAAAGNRPAAGALRTIYDLCARPEGCTREEARVALGRRSPPQMRRLTDDAGVALRMVGQRYFLAEQPAVNSAAAPVANAATEISLAGWCAALGLGDAAKAFWQERHDTFSRMADEAPIGFRPGTLAARRAGF